MRLKTTLFVLVGSFVLACGAMAQQLPSAPHLDLLHRGTFLLTTLTVQDEMKLSDEQRINIGRIFQRLGETQGAQLASDRPDEAAVKNADKVATDSVLRVLTNAQQADLAKLAVHYAGIPGLLEPEVIKALRIGENQLQRIHQVIDAAEAQTMQLDATITNAIQKDPKHSAEINASYKPSRRKALKDEHAAELKALDALTEPQRKQWSDLGGVS